MRRKNQWLIPSRSLEEKLISKLGYPYVLDIKTYYDWTRPKKKDAYEVELHLEIKSKNLWKYLLIEVDSLRELTH